MSNFKSGSGNLDFGGDDGDEDADDGGEPDESVSEREEREQSEAGSTESTAEDPGGETRSGRTDTGERTTTDRDPVTETSTDPEPSIDEYPYFVRRNNVGDERDTRLEIHVRDEVADREAEFRNAVAEHLGTGEISKTDAREFALLAAYEHPEKVAELMEDEGFGALE